MQKILFKRSLRNLKSNFVSYLAIFLLMILAMTIVVANNTSANTVITRTIEVAEKANVEDGEFMTILPLSDADIDSITSTGVDVERTFYLDYSAKDESTVRIFRERQKINKQTILEGKAPTKKNELAIEKHYARVHKLKVGDKLVIGKTKLAITGVMIAPDYECVLENNATSFTDPNSFGIGIMTDEGYDFLKNRKSSKGAETYLYSYKLNGKLNHEELKSKLKNIKITSEDIKGLPLTHALLIGESKFAFQLKAIDNLRIKAAANDQIVNEQTGIFAGILILLLIAYVLSVFVSHEIEEDSHIIGTLYSLGVRRRDLILHYLYVPVFVTLVGGIIGYLIGFTKPFYGTQMQTCYEYFSIPELAVTRPWYLIVYAIVLPPIIAVAVNFISIFKKLNKPVLALIRREPKVKKKESKIKLNKLKFTQKFQLRQFFRETKANIAVVCGLFFALLIVMLPLCCFSMCNSLTDGAKNDVKFEYLYTYKYPTEEVPEGGKAGYGETFKMENLGYTFDITLLGINKDKDNAQLDNQYFDITLPKGKDEVLISSAMAEKFNLKPGESVTFPSSDGEKKYTFKIKGIYQFESSFYMFTDIDNMRELFGKESDYFNVVFASKKLDIPTDNLYATSTKADIIKASEIVTEIMMPMVYSLIIVGVLIFVIVMYLMLKMMIDKSKRSISLLGVLGYRANEIRKLYLDGNFFVIAISSLITIPLAKLAMNLIYPIMCSNVSCGINISLHWYTYVILYVAIIALYLVINSCLVFKIKKIDPCDVVKNRE